EEIAKPLGADYLIAFGPEHDHRCAEMVGSKDDVGGTATREWRAAGDGAATAFGTADGLARVYAALARDGELDGVRLLRPETIEASLGSGSCSGCATTTRRRSPRAPHRSTARSWAPTADGRARRDRSRGRRSAGDRRAASRRRARLRTLGRHRDRPADLRCSG